MFLQDSEGVNKNGVFNYSFQYAHKTTREKLYSLINIFFRECMIEVWGNYIFNSILNMMLDELNC